MNVTATNEWYTVLNNQDLLNFIWTDPEWFIHVLELPICFWSSA